MEKLDYLLDKTNLLMQEISEMEETDNSLQTNLTTFSNLALANQTNISNLQTSVNKINSNISNPNLLINGDFRINQRGQANYTAAVSSIPTYMIDRWAMTWAGSLTSINDNSISIQFVRQYSAFKQMIENYKDFKGKTLTASFKIANLSATSGVYIRISDGVGSSSKEIKSANGSFFVTRTIDENATELNVNILNTNATGTTVTLDIEYAKLEFGELATPFNPRPYAEELEMCKRYYYKKETNTTANNYGLTFAYSTTLVGSVLETNLRISPTINFSNITYRSGTTSSSSVTNLIVASFVDGIITLNATTSNATAGQCGLLRASGSNSYINLDAEIY